MSGPGALCAVCGLPIEAADYDERHWLDEDQAEVHADCCPCEVVP